ncbi:MAG: TIR domain-containing protein [Hyphomicrobiales bacterium]|nr:TIR domain-containing protein [Hyphomicrobiales bacterium]
MAVFYSFHYDRDSWRVQQVINMGALEGQPLLKPQEWEEAKKKAGGIEKWIEEQMKYKTALVVLIGAQTASRPWVKYEIKKAWRDKKRLVGVRIHGLEGSDRKTDSQGANPFAKVSLTNGKKTSDYVPVHNPSGADSKAVYASIKNNLATWVNGGYKPS